jgi:ABC-type multidrug transport system fused ATPase/permease subunit
MRRFPTPQVGVPDCRSPVRYLRWIAGHFRGPIVLGIGYGVVCTLGQALVPAAIGKAIDAGIVARNQEALLWWGGVVLILGLVQAATGILQDRSAATSSLGAAYQTMQLITAQASRLGAALSTRMSTGEVVSVGVADIRSIGETLGVTARAAGSAVAIVVVAAIMLNASWRLGLVVLIGVPLILWAIALLIRPLHGRQRWLRERQGELTSQAVDIVSGLRVVRGIGGEDAFAGRYREESQRARHAGVQVARVEAVLDGVRVLLPGLLVALVVWLGARQVLAGQLSIGQLVAFYGYAVFLTVPLRRLTQATSQFMKGHVAAQRVTHLLGLQPELTSGSRAPQAYHDEVLLADPESGLVLRDRQFTAVACASSADAGVLADRLGRYADSAVTYRSVALHELPLEEVRRRILVAGNDARLFSGPLRTELDPGDRAPEDADRLLAQAIDGASAGDIIEALPAGLDEMIVGAGREFSGGQQQRLRLVRALMADPEVLVLVEPTSAVDAHTEARIGERLTARRAGKATVVFTTSPIMLDHADQVSFVQAGKVVAEGSHSELLADARYRSVVARDEDA